MPPRAPRLNFDDPWLWGLLTVSAAVHAAALIWVGAPRWLSVGMGLPLGMCGWMWWSALQYQRRLRARRKSEGG